MVAGMLNSVFEQPDAESVHRQYQEVCAALDGKFPDAVALIESAETGVLAAVSAFPVEHRKRIRSNNLDRRPNKEIRRRTDVVRIFPTAPRSSASSAPCSPNNTRNGPAPVAT
jgi:transposase-like protein